MLRRLFGRGGPAGSELESGAAVRLADAADQPSDDEIERAHELDVLRADEARLDDLQRRQLKYADRAWTPPPQGGPRRAGDEERAD